MNTRLARFTDRFKESLWAIPTLFVVCALLAVAGTQVVDAILPKGTNDALRAYQPQSADGVRAVLAAIATTMIGLAGVGFSITVVTLSLAASQFGPRLLRSFTRDYRNHVVLGTLVAAFVYCLALLITVRVASDDSFEPPVLGVTVAFLLALAGLAAFVYFVHHVARQIQANHVVATVAKELHEAIDRLFPVHDDPASRLDAAVWRRQRAPDWRETAVGAHSDGYVQALDVERLLELATQHDHVVEAVIHAGDFVNRETRVFVVHGAHAVAESVREELSKCCLVGRDRTVVQDFEFAIHQLVEVALRALSPSMNDPFTAITCADHLGAAYARIGARAMPVNVFRDESGAMRVLLPRVTFPDVFDAGTQQLRQNALSSPAVSIRLIDVFKRLLPHLREPADREVVARQARAVAAGAGAACAEPLDRQAIEDRLGQFEDALRSLSG